MSTSRTATAIVLVLLGVVSVSAGCFLLSLPIGLIALGAMLVATGLLLDLGRRT